MAERREHRPERVEVHVAGTCFRADHPPSILVARRAADRELYPGMWEGCGGQLRAGEMFTEGLRRHFAEELGIDVEVLDQHVLYDIPTPDGVIPGIRFLCRYQGGVAASPNHSEVAWLPWEEFLALDPAQCVPGLQRDVERLIGRLASPLADDIAAWRRYASSAARESSTYGGREMVALAVRTADALEGMGKLEAEVRRLLALHGPDDLIGQSDQAIGRRHPEAFDLAKDFPRIAAILRIADELEARSETAERLLLEVEEIEVLDRKLHGRQSNSWTPRQIAILLRAQEKLVEALEDSKETG